MPSPQQNAEDYPRQTGKQRFVCDILSEHVIQENEAGNQGQCQQHLATQQELKEQGFHGLQWRKGAIEPDRIAVFELVVLNCQQGCLEGRNSQNTVGQDRQQYMYQDGGFAGDERGAVTWKQPG